MFKVKQLQTIVNNNNQIRNPTKILYRNNQLSKKKRKIISHNKEGQYRQRYRKYRQLKEKIVDNNQNLQKSIKIDLQKNKRWKTQKKKKVVKLKNNMMDTQMLINKQIPVFNQKKFFSDQKSSHQKSSHQTPRYLIPSPRIHKGQRQLTRINLTKMNDKEYNKEPMAKIYTTGQNQIPNQKQNLKNIQKKNELEVKEKAKEKVKKKVNKKVKKKVIKKVKPSYCDDCYSKLTYNSLLDITYCEECENKYCCNCELEIKPQSERKQNFFSYSSRYSTKYCECKCSNCLLPKKQNNSGLCKSCKNHCSKCNQSGNWLMMTTFDCNHQFCQTCLSGVFKDPDKMHLWNQTQCPICWYF